MQTGRQQRGVVNRYAADRHRPAAPLLHPWRSDPAVLRRAEPWRDRAAGLFDAKMPFNEDAEYWLRVAAVAPLHHQAVAAGAQTRMVRQPRVGEIRAGEPRLQTGDHATDAAPGARSGARSGRAARRGSRTRRRFTSSRRATGRARDAPAPVPDARPPFREGGCSAASVLPALRPGGGLRAARTIWSRRRPGLR
jgi:hypothetical protein